MSTNIYRADLTQTSILVMKTDNQSEIPAWTLCTPWKHVTRLTRKWDDNERAFRYWVVLDDKNGAGGAYEITTASWDFIFYHMLERTTDF